MTGPLVQLPVVLVARPRESRSSRWMTGAVGAQPEHTNMNTSLPAPPEGTLTFRPSSDPHLTGTPKTRVAVFGSFQGGYHVLRELLHGPLAERVTVVGVPSDDPTQAFTHPHLRLWKYPHERAEEVMTPLFARAQGLPVFTGRVKTPEFYSLLMDVWRPDLCLMATFGQKIPTPLIQYPSLGFYNFHHSGDAWPSYPGPDPIAAMVRDGRTHLVLTLHAVTDVIDGGAFVARSQPVAIPAGINAIGMHRITWPQMGPFIRRAVGDLLPVEASGQTEQPLMLQESPVSYRVCQTEAWPERLAA